MKNYDEYLYLELWTYNIYSATKSEDNAMVFLVPLDWVKTRVWDCFNMPIEEFMEWYTYDHSELIFQAAHQDMKIKHVQTVGGDKGGIS